ncbi:MAG: outer membrane protein assembly factor BamA [Candidatus Kapaibacteriota bacterium]
MKHRLVWCISFLFLFCFLSYQLNSQTQKNYIIADISVEGNKSSDALTIISLSGLNRGETISFPYDTKLQKAIKNLWNRKQFSDVQILVDKIVGNSIFLVIKVKEYPRISEITIKNNKKVSKEDLMKIINKNRGDIISKYEVYQIEQRIKRKYQDEDLPFAMVKAELIPTDTQNYFHLVVNIDEGFKYKVESITFVGNNSLSNDELAGAFKETKTKHWWQFWRSANFEPKKYEEDKDLLLKYCRNNGFIDFEILGDTVIYDDKEKVVHIKIFVNEGKKYYIRNIYFLGNTVFPNEALQRRLDISKGEIYNQEKLQQNLSGNKENTDAMSLYFDNGYLFARNEIQEVRVEPDSLDLYIRIYEGNRVTIRKVEIVGNTKTKDKVIRRELYTYPGDYFNRSAIIKSVRALGLLNYFNPETLRPDVKMVDNTKVDIAYQVEERSTDTFNASIGFAGSFGLTGAIGFSFNNFSLLEPLKGGGGQLFNFNLEFGQANRYRTFSIGFTEPWLFDEPTTLGFNLYDTRIIYNPIDLRRTGFGINIGRRLRWPDDYFRIDGGIRIQRNNVGSGYSNYYRPGVSTEFTISESISRISLDNIFFPTTGSRFSWSNDLALGSIGIGTTDFFKSQLRFEMNQTLLKINELPRVVLNVTSNWGYITGLKNDTTINPIELFFMGGTGLSSGFPVTPLRGYPDQSIGPRSGGKVFARHFAELRFAVSLDPMPIYFYGFVEAGNVWSSLDRTDPFNLKRSAGVGVQIFLQALGIIGFSYGYGFDKTDDTGQLSGWRFLFHIGQ